ncbi:rhophilin-2 isoform X2 [Parasteatoda tepidariorum]|uniref:rhophilin-2 isoform X2 n=1 Tax=Parasteatoda tepidariorum TaxID=114398 RepID=UPI00077FBA8C|nr:rhophilin-2 isoform X2 [Parasteatoda tepidariorum]
MKRFEGAKLLFITPVKDKSLCYDKTGTDPLAATCRGRLQIQRAKLNQEINYQTMMRNGAEKLYKATVNKKLKETIALELSFVNSSLQLLKEQLADLNSSVMLYQNNSSIPTMPMVPLGLKETKEIDFKEPFKDFILEHYSEDDSKFDSAIQQLNQIRQAVRTPSRDASGVKMLFQYYNLLYFIDKRFFASHRNLGLHFEWFDSLTGLPSMQKSIAFEKASILFNIAALYTQIGAKQDRTKNEGMDAAVDSFLRGAGIFHFLKQNFSNPPSTDLSPEVLDMLTHLMLAQARECLFEKLVSDTEKRNFSQCLDIAQEAAQVSEVYRQLYTLLSSTAIKDCVPNSWGGLMHVKTEHYSSQSHYYVALALISYGEDFNTNAQEKLEHLHIEIKSNDRKDAIRTPRNANERLRLGRAHLHHSITTHEEALRTYRMCRQLQLIDSLYDLLQKTNEKSLTLLSKLIDDVDQFQDVFEPPAIRASTKFQLKLTDPDFNQHKAVDLFKALGPLKFFSAKRHWTAARIVELKKSSDDSTFGFSVKDNSPVVVTRVEIGGIAEGCGLKEGDYITAVNDEDTKWTTHEEMAELIRNAGNTITLKVVTPMNWKYLHSRGAAGMSICSKSTSSSSSGFSSSSSRNPSPVGSVNGRDCDKRGSWNPFRRRNSKDPLESSYITNILYR